MDIYILDDNYERRITFRRLLAQISGKLRIIGEERLAGIALPLLDRLRPELVIVDYYTYQQHYQELSQLPFPMILVCDFPPEEDDPPLSGNICDFLLTANLTTESISRTLRRYFPYVLEEPSPAALEVFRSVEKLLELPPEKAKSHWGLLILSLPDQTLSYYAVEYLQWMLSDTAFSGCCRLLEDSPDRAVLLFEACPETQQVSGAEGQPAAFIDTLDRLQLPPGTHYLTFPPAELLQVRHTLEQLPQALEQCFFALAKYVPLTMPLRRPVPVPAEELEKRLRELQERLYTKDAYGFFALLRELYTVVLAGSRHIPSCRMAHELLREIWSRSAPGKIKATDPLPFDRGASLQELYENISNHFVDLFPDGVPRLSSATSCAIRFLLEHYEQPIALSETARALGLSNSYLSRRFRADTGITLSDYLRHIRIDHACLMLHSERHYRISQVAEQCGFSNPRYFADCFKKATGMTPLEFRQSRGGMDC